MIPHRPTRQRPARGRPLLAYFSRAGEKYHYCGRIDLEVGNTAVVAGIIADLIEVDLYEIRPADPYPHDYEATVERNTLEHESDARPAIAENLPDLERYDTILLGSGAWSFQAPMIMHTFAESFDFTGRMVLPFVTHAVSGMGQVADQYAELCAAPPSATVWLFKVRRLARPVQTPATSRRAAVARARELRLLDDHDGI